MDLQYDLLTAQSALQFLNSVLLARQIFFIYFELRLFKKPIKSEVFLLTKLRLFGFLKYNYFFPTVNEIKE